MDLKEKVTSFRGFLEQRKKIVAPLSALLILLSAVLFFYMVKKNHSLFPPEALLPPTHNQTSAEQHGSGDIPEGEKVEILPQEERIEDEYPLQLPDPFATPPRLVGVLLDDGEGNLAIIEVGGSAYLVTEGETVAGLWTVKDIFRDRVKIVSEYHETFLLLGR